MTLAARTRTAVFQSPSAPKPYPVGHEALDGQAGELAQGAEVLERRGERGSRRPASRKERSAELDLRAP